MNKNSYVTAALFVVFVLLTVFYISIGDSNDSTTNKVGSTSTLPQANLEINPTDAQSGSELVSNQESGDDETETAGTSMIKAKGYSDVLVRVNEETVQVHLQLSESQSEPTLEQTNEIIMMVKTEFTTDPDVLVQLTPIN